MELKSPDFKAEGEIPTRYTCEGHDTAPALSWSGVPTGTKSLALIVSDPDAPDPQAPKTTWFHWVLTQIPPGAHGLPEGAHPSPDGAHEGKNSWNKLGYGGPCPPIGRHRYFFRLYALDVDLKQLAHPTAAELQQAMKGHVLATAELMGTYQKKR